MDVSPVLVADLQAPEAVAPGRKTLTGFAGLRPAGGKGDQTDQESRSSAAGSVPSIRPVQMGRFTHWRNCDE